jgi:3-methylcrotonyl-CoA carboxylase alpha subunit
MKLFNKILVANRGEIAVRIIKTLKESGVLPVAVYSPQDRNTLHVRLAGEAYELGGDSLAGTYLDIQKIIYIALQSGTDAIHPGYGFLSENAAFARAAADAGINFIGPDPEVIELMGNKIMAGKAMQDAGIPMILGFKGSARELYEMSGSFEFPVLVKAAAGGGGKAMRIVNEASYLLEALEITAREAKNYFGNDLLFVEKYIPEARHIEVQVIADHYGNTLILGERECSVQRRYQKVVEESPAVSISRATREKLYDTALRIVKLTGYTNAGTIEFLVGPGGEHYFLEMNTRIQVEHPVTEMVTGLDIVSLQLQIAAGNELVLKQEDIIISGHAIEARVYAEDPENNFLPSPGKISLYSEPSIPGLRIDTGIDRPDTLYPDYDPLIAKVIFHAHTRDEAIRGLDSALKEFKVLGTQTNIEFLSEILKDEEFTSNRISTSWLEIKTGSLYSSLHEKKSAFPFIRVVAAWIASKTSKPVYKPGDSVWNAIGYWRHSPFLSAVFEGKRFDVEVVLLSQEKIKFTVGSESHIMTIKSQSYTTIIFELDGTWSSASVAGTDHGEDIIHIGGFVFRVKPFDRLPLYPLINDRNEKGNGGIRLVKAPLYGKISGIISELAYTIKTGDFLYSIDAMKIENRISSPFNGRLKEIHVKQGDQVSINQTIMTIEESN